jgi:hypothetical protein
MKAFSLSLTPASMEKQFFLNVLERCLRLSLIPPGNKGILHQNTNRRANIEVSLVMVPVRIEAIVKRFRKLYTPEIQKRASELVMTILRPAISS